MVRLCLQMDEHIFQKMLNQEIDLLFNCETHHLLYIRAVFVPEGIVTGGKLFLISDKQPDNFLEVLWLTTLHVITSRRVIPDHEEATGDIHYTSSFLCIHAAVFVSNAISEEIKTFKMLSFLAWWEIEKETRGRIISSAKTELTKTQRNSL